MKTKLLTFLFILGAFGSTDLLAQETTRQFPRQDQNAQPRAQQRQQRPQRTQQGERHQRPQPDQQGAQQRPSREQMREHLIQRFDRDGDGQLSQEERGEARQAVQARRQEMQNSGRGNQTPNRGDGVRGRRRQSEDFRGRRLQNQGQATGRLERGQREEFERRSERGQREGAERNPRNGEGRGQLQKGNTQEVRRARILQHFDANQDGKLDEHERVALQEAMQKRRAEMQRQEPNSTRGARQERGRQGRENAGAPRSGHRQFPR